MSNHDNDPIELRDEDNAAACSDAAGEPTPFETGELDFRITVRKVQTKVQARGVLAE